MRRRSVVLLPLSCAALLAASPVRAQAPPGVRPAAGEIEALRAEIAGLRRDYADRLARLEERLAALESAPASPSPAPTAPAAPPGNRTFNPDIAVIGNFIATGGHNRVAPGPSLELAESEVSFQAAVDPYARADFFLSFSEEGAEVEEGFITFPTLPAGLLLKAGQIKLPFGRVNALHPHNLSWVDQPLVLENLLGGEEGLKDAGFTVSRLIPNGFAFLEATGGVYRGESGVFAAPEASDLTWLARLRGYRDLGESANLDLGLSFATGHNDAGDDTRSRLYGLDATWRWKPLRRGLYRSFFARSELVWSEREEAAGERDAFGWYGAADYQLGRRWFVGGRYDWAERALEPGAHDQAASLILTFWPSEFSQVRGQYRRIRYPDDQTADQVLFQLLFSIGAHGAHPF